MAEEELETCSILNRGFSRLDSFGFFFLVPAVILDLRFVGKKRLDFFCERGNPERDAAISRSVFVYDFKPD